MTDRKKYYKHLHFRGAMSGKWVRSPKCLRASVIRECGYEVRFLTDAQARKLNEAVTN